MILEEIRMEELFEFVIKAFKFVIESVLYFSLTALFDDNGEDSKRFYCGFFVLLLLAGSVQRILKLISKSKEHKNARFLGREDFDLKWYGFGTAGIDTFVKEYFKGFFNNSKNFLHTGTDWRKKSAALRVLLHEYDKVHDNGSTFVKDHFFSPPIHHTDLPQGSMMHCCFFIACQQFYRS